MGATDTFRSISTREFPSKTPISIGFSDCGISAGFWGMEDAYAPCDDKEEDEQANAVGYQKLTQHTGPPLERGYFACSIAACRDWQLEVVCEDLAT
jgi:hypothetical protein